MVSTAAAAGGAGRGPSRAHGPLPGSAPTTHPGSVSRACDPPVLPPSSWESWQGRPGPEDHRTRGPRGSPAHRHNPGRPGGLPAAQGASGTSSQTGGPAAAPPPSTKVAPAAGRHSHARAPRPQFQQRLPERHLWAPSAPPASRALLPEGPSPRRGHLCCIMDKTRQPRRLDETRQLREAEGLAPGAQPGSRGAVGAVLQRPCSSRPWPWPSQ